jgi:lysophospholipid acyltransferase (LPLAT)-like uncharacterized protein
VRLAPPNAWRRSPPSWRRSAVSGPVPAAVPPDAAAEKRARRKARELRLIVGAGSVFVKLLAKTWRVRQHGRAPSDAYRAGGRPVIFACWHGEMLPLLWSHRNEGITLLISASRDGEIIAQIAESLGFRAVRGSSTRGGARALLGIVRELQDGNDVAFTPDGPRGPAFQFAPGVVVASAKGDAPIVLVKAHPTSAWRLRSWDAFMIPKPFSRVDVHWSEPIAAGGDAVEFAAQLALRLRDLGAA